MALVPEPKTQVEIQLGHMCNNRCVFCVSGQQTELGRARPLPTEPLLAEIERARAQGHRKLTILGGEPTLQPGFFDVVRRAVALGFEEIVLFTNGVKTAREGFVDEVIALGGNFTWRISIQGANKLAHERTTHKPGSFDRIVASMGHLARRGQRITVNMCVVTSNYESVGEFPELLLPYGVSQLHLDMMRPLDAGERSEAELAQMIPRYSEMVAPLTRMVHGFPEGFDVNIGNLPYCIAPELLPFVHHDGERTYTIAVDGERDLSRPWDKYFVKRRDKLKPERCKECLLESRCSGIFEKYREIHGDAELVPITAEKLAAIDPEKKFFGLHLVPVLRRFDGFEPPAPFAGVRAEVRGDREAAIELGLGDEKLSVALREPGGGIASFDRFSLHLVEAPRDEAALRAGLYAIWEHLCAGGHAVVHPLGEDALAARASAAIRARLGRLRRSAPFGPLAWREVSIDPSGRRAELALEGPGGERAAVWLDEDERAGRVRGGYRVEGQPTAALVDGIGAVMQALRA